MVALREDPRICPLERLDRFEVLGRLGRGGMSTVYLARLEGPGGFDKRVALKVLHPRLATRPDVLELFFHEARVGCRLSHPNVVQVLELGQWHGLYYIVMEYLEGRSLADLATRAWRQGRPVEPRLACHVGRQVCEALHHAHEAYGADGRPLGLVHLVGSPQNLLVTVSGTVKLLDFGIARSVGLTDSSPRCPLRGKLSYVSPEQVDGSEPDRRSDVFALGIVLWEMLAGQPLFAGDNPLQCLYRVSSSPVPPLPDLRQDVPPGLGQGGQGAPDIVRPGQHRKQDGHHLLAVAARLHVLV